MVKTRLTKAKEQAQAKHPLEDSSDDDTPLIHLRSKAKRAVSNSATKKLKIPPSSKKRSFSVSSSDDKPPTIASSPAAKKMKPPFSKKQSLSVANSDNSLANAPSSSAEKSKASSSSKKRSTSVSSSKDKSQANMASPAARRQLLLRRNVLSLFLLPLRSCRQRRVDLLCIQQVPQRRKGRHLMQLSCHF
eukprot:scaffold19380_cov81-Skeletonema_menzelii.AAC.3